MREARREALFVERNTIIHHLPRNGIHDLPLTLHMVSVATPLQPGRRRYSAYPQYGNRDGPQMAYGLHPSRR